MSAPWTNWRQRPVIVVPGITATTLHDEYPLSREDLWTTVLHKEFERLAMHPSNPRYETLEPAMVRAGRLFGLVYDDLIKALRYELTDRTDRPVPVFPFPYDWRQDLSTAAGELSEFIAEVLDRTNLLRNYRGFEDERRVMALGSRDFSFWELKDRLLAGASGLHALFPSMNKAQRLITRHLKPDYAAPLQGAGRPVPGVAPQDWQPPIRS